MRARPRRAPPVYQVGLLAQLRRVEPAHAGRIVLVQGPATTVRAPGRAFPLFAWRVAAMGRDLELNGCEVSDVIVAEISLQPICRLTLRQARSLVVAQATSQAEAAVRAFGQALAAHPLDDDELDAELRAAAREALARWASPPVLLPAD
jgi:hypothetical protein